MTTINIQIEIKIFLKKILSIIAIILTKSIKLFPKRQNNFNNRTAIIALHKLGDTVFTIPAVLEYLKNTDNDVYIFCFEESEIIYRQIIENVKYVHLNKNDFYFNGRFVNRGSRKIIKETSPEIIIDMTGSITSASLIFNSRCQNVYGINAIFYKSIYNYYKEIRTTPHQIDLYFDCIEELVPELSRNFQGYGFNHTYDGEILIQPCAGWVAKEWGLLKFINLYNNLNLKNSCRFVFPSGTFKKDILAQFNLDKIKYIECVNIEQLIQEIRKCKLFISNDSGPLQIAALLKKPTFCIYGPTNPDYHVPVGKYHHYINKSLICSPVNQKFCSAAGGRNCFHFNCMNLLSENNVYFGVDKLLVELDDWQNDENHHHNDDRR